MVVHSTGEPLVKKLKLKQLLPFMDEGGSVPKLPNLQDFSTSGEGQMTLEDAKAQMEEIKRLADLKAKKQKSEMKLKRVLTVQELKARAAELAAYVEKRVEMIEEYNHYQKSYVYLFKLRAILNSKIHRVTESFSNI
ncbi:hypothetical protein Tco_0201404 [Tanacetum coccineum]